MSGDPGYDPDPLDDEYSQADIYGWGVDPPTHQPTISLEQPEMSIDPRLLDVNTSETAFQQGFDTTTTGALDIQSSRT